MSIASVDEFKGFYRTTIDADTPTLQVCLDAAIKGLNRLCGREWVVASTDPDEATARTYRPDECTQWLRIHDCTSIVSVVENGVTLTGNTDYTTDPISTVGWTGETVPVERLKRRYNNWWTDTDIATVTVTGLWGWAAIPTSIKMACYIGTKDLADTRDVKLGIADISQYGPMRVRENPEVRRLASGYIRAEAAFGIA